MAMLARSVGFDERLIPPMAIWQEVGLIPQDARFRALVLAGAALACEKSSGHAG